MFFCIFVSFEPGWSKVGLGGVGIPRSGDNQGRITDHTDSSKLGTLGRLDNFQVCCSNASVSVGIKQKHRGAIPELVPSNQ